MAQDLVVFSHLRWNWVWQRPQQLVSRLTSERKVWFVEEPGPAPVHELVLRRQEDGGRVTRVWLDVPDEGRHLGFEPRFLERYAQDLPGLLGPAERRIVWLYSPLALDVALSLDPDLVVYDVMDDLASFKDAAPELMTRHRQTLRRADLIFAGGRTLHRGVSRVRADALLFPSGVDPEHYRAARSHRRTGETPVAGYVGVIDERLDLELLDGLAAALFDWEIQLVGPVAKIEPSDLPNRPNLCYVGAQPYERLPEVMAGFDVALMPFALNEATRSISPTKTLEYLAAGLPVVSTRVQDVVASFGSVIDLQDDAAGFAASCRQLLHQEPSARERKVEPLLQTSNWDTISRTMDRLMTAALGVDPMEMPA